jgi:hypothetical protein
MSRFFYVGPLLIYFPRILPGYETQPTYFLSLCLLALVVGAKNFRALASLMTVVGFVSIVGMVLIWQEAIDTSTMISNWLLILGPVFLIGALAYDLAPPSRLFIAGVTLIFLATALIELLLPSTYVAISDFLLDRTNTFNAHRGSSFLTPEPSYAVCSLVYVWMLARFSAHFNGQKYPWIEWLIVGMLALTLSTFAVIFFIVFSFLRWPLVVFAGLAAVILFANTVNISALGNDDGFRALIAISRLFSVEIDNLLPSLNALDASLASRIISNLAGFSTVAYYPFGVGLQCQSLLDVVSTGRLTVAFENEALMSKIASGCLYPAAYMPALFLGLGWTSVAVLLMTSSLVWVLFWNKTQYRIDSYPLCAALLMFMLQSQISSPIPWMLVYMSFFAPILRVKTPVKSPVLGTRTKGHTFQPRLKNDRLR